MPAATFDTELALVVAEANKGWVLDGICRETAARLSVDHRVCYLPADLPAARAYFFSHWSLALDARRRYHLPRKSRILAYYTHPRAVGARPRRLVQALNRCDAILSMSSMHARALVSSGVDRDRVTTVLGAADPLMFGPSAETGDSVGLVSAYYERKRPDLILDVVRSLPHRRFLLLGRGWEGAAIWPELAAAPNLESLSPAYSQYPELYRRMGVFLSPSALEGGPIPLLEAMLTGVTPVATRTGFAPDLIVDGDNGYLCDIDAGAHDVAQTVEAAFARPGRNVRGSVEHLTWARYARILEELAFPSSR